MAVLKAEDRKALKADEFAVPGKRQLPIHDAKHVRLAWDMVDRTKGLTSSERAGARRKILSAAKKFGIDTSEWTKSDMADTVASVPEVLTDATEAAGTLRARFKGTQANVVNANNRLYPKDVLTDAVERFKAKLPVLGESPHPEVKRDKNGRVLFDSKLENNVIKIVDAYMDGDVARFDAEVLNTAKGKDLRALVDSRSPVGVSIRMLGNSVQRDINGVLVDVATFLDIHTWDVVMNPATDGCGFEEVLTDEKIEAIFEDGIKPQACPKCGKPLEEMAPDGDADIDFLACVPCVSAFVQDSSLRQETYTSYTLTMVTPDNWDRYGLAREWLEQQSKKETLTDSVTMEDEINMDNLKNNPEFLALVAEEAGKKALEIVKPALDAVEAQKADKAKSDARAEAKAFLDEKTASLQEKIGAKAVKMIRDSIGDVDSKEKAEAMLDSALKIVSAAGAKAFVDDAGFDPANASQKGQTRVEVGDGPKPWRAIVDAICKEMDSYGEQFGKSIDPKLRDYNRKHVINKISSEESRKGMTLLDHIEDSIGMSKMQASVHEGRLRVFNDNVAGAEYMDAVSVTTQQLLNQPTILTAVIVQAFQDVEAAQFMFTDVFRGSEWRLPIETFTSGAGYNPATGLLDLAVAEGVGIGASAINLSWQSFSPTWRRNAVSLTTDVVRALETGPASYGAIARALYHIAEDKKRKLDNASYLEMIMASDEYNPLAVADEVPAAANLVTSVGVPAGSNAAFLYKLRPATPDESIGYNPVVRPRTVNQIQPSGQVTATTTNPVSVNVGSTALVLGVWDGVNIVSFPGTTATCAIDFEHGIVYFTASSGVNPAASTPVLPSISYSAVTNYDRWHTTMANGYTDIAAYYDTFLQRLTNTSALMGSSPRFKKPNLMIGSLNSATYVENARIFYKWASPDGTKLIDTGNTFGQRSNMNLSKINAPWAAGDGRVLLTQKGSTRYGIETPYQMEGPHPMYDGNGNIIDAKLWYGRENSVLCTPQVRDTNFKIINPVSRTIIIQP